MPRGKSKNGGDPQAIVRMPFRVLTTVAISNSAAINVGSLNLSAANLGARIATAAPDFEFFRVANLRVYAYTDCCGPVSPTGAGTFGPVNASYGIAFDPTDSTDTTSPTTYAQLTQYAHAKFGGVYAKLQIQLSAKDLWKATPTKWYNTASTGSPPALSLSAGTLYMLTQNSVGSLSGVATAFAILEGVCEFMGNVTPALALTDYAGPEIKVVETPLDGQEADFDDCKSEQSGSQKPRSVSVRKK